MRRPDCATNEAPYGCGEAECQDCCEHFEHDHGICMDCGADITNILVGKAEAAAEGYDR